MTMTTQESFVNGEGLRAALQKILDKDSMERFLSGKILVNGDKVVITTPNEFTSQWVNRKFRKDIISAAENLGINTPVLLFKEDPSIIRAPVEKEENNTEAIIKNIPISEKPKMFPEERVHGSPLPVDYTIFPPIIAEHNKRAHGLLKLVFDTRTPQMHNAFIQGPTGTGKTHLVVNALYDFLKNNSGEAHFGSARDFKRIYLESFGEGKFNPEGKFIREMERLGFFIIDDLHKLRPSSGTQDALVDIIEYFNAKRKPVVFLSEYLVDAKEFPKLDSRLVSRLGGFATAQINYPSLEDAMKIVPAMIIYGTEGIKEVDLDVARYIISLSKEAGAIKPRLLHANSQMVSAFAMIEGKEQVDLNFAEYALGGKRVQGLEELSYDTFLDEVAKAYDVSQQSILGEYRGREVVAARDHLTYLLKEYNGLSNERIGQVLGGRNHSTVTTALKRFRAKITESPDFKKRVDGLNERFGSPVQGRLDFH